MLRNVPGNAVQCDGDRSALHVPMQCSAMADEVHCVFGWSALHLRGLCYGTSRIMLSTYKQFELPHPLKWEERSKTAERKEQIGEEKGTDRRKR